jgi:hypothetical protein
VVTDIAQFDACLSWLLVVLQEQLLNEEAMLLKGYDQAVRELREKAREAPLKEDNLACVESWNTPEVLGKLETM